jgi:hypothetical protein
MAISIDTGTVLVNGTANDAAGVNSRFTTLDASIEDALSSLTEITDGVEFKTTNVAASSIKTVVELEWDPSDGSNLTDNSSGIALDFVMPDDGDNQDTYARIVGMVRSDSAGAEEGELSFRGIDGGTVNTEWMTVSGAGVTIPGILDVNGSIDADVTDVDIASSGDIDLTSTSNAADAIYLRTNGGTSETIKIHADQGSGAGSITLVSDAGGIDVDATAGGVTIDSAGISLDASAASNFTTSSGALTITSAAAATWSTAAGALTINGTTGINLREGGSDIITISNSRAVATANTASIDLDASGAITMNSSGGTLSIGNDNDDQVVNLATAGTRTLNIGINDGTDITTIVSKGNITNTGTLTVGVNDAGHDVKFFGDTDGKYLLWDTSADSLNLIGDLDVNGAADISGDLTLSAGADGALRFTNAGENSIKIPDNQASALIIEEANDAYMTFITTNSSEAVSFSKNVGVGTTAPNSTSGRTWLTIDNSTAGGALESAINGNAAWQLSTDADYGLYLAIDPQTNGTNSYFQVGIDGSTKWWLDKDGRVGIGAAPSQSNTYLHSASSGVSRMRVSTSSQSSSCSFDIQTNGTATNQLQLRFIEGGGDGSTGNMGYVFYQDNNNNRFAVNSADTDGSATAEDIIRINDGSMNLTANASWLDTQFDFVCNDCGWHALNEPENAECPDCGGLVEWHDDNALIFDVVSTEEKREQGLDRLGRLGVIYRYGEDDGGDFLCLQNAQQYTWSAMSQMYQAIKSQQAEIESLKRKVV